MGYQYINLDYLREHSRSNKKIEKNMLEIFILQLKKFSIQMNTFAEDGKWYLLGGEAFFAKETIRVFGLHEMANELHKLDHLCRKHSNNEGIDLSSSVAVPIVFDNETYSPTATREILEIVQKFSRVAEETLEEVKLALLDYE
ncbi:MAG: hypothetical protein K9H64_23955 [Bacteroidales bacterium]|nr:hypothetical protein [Bacteroidales bacterium]MCF8455938.1 hypothetical protein [Bacteroidales bacterium]